MRREAKLAKLMRPRLHGVVNRERLFEMLDQVRERPVIWVCGPPGAGKTTLIASYIEQSAAAAIWYQLDSADSDPASFFYYLVRAIRASAGARVRLPLLTPEYLADLEGFARRFCRDAFASLAQGSLLVLDNYHELAADSALHRALNAAFAEVPPAANVIVISRAPPPAIFSRLQLADALGLIGWEALRLCEDETAAIVVRRCAVDAQMVASIHAQSGGWVAGVRLLLERLEPGRADMPLHRPEALEPAFEYFAAEIFERAPEALRQLLLRTAFMPRFTPALAVAISGDAQAGRRIEELYRRRLFVDRRAGKEATYQYHDLFRAFLRAQAEQSLPAEEVAALSGRTAELLVAAGLSEDAFGLFVRAGDWSRAEAIFLHSARDMISQGRWQTVDDWGAGLPRERISAHPWVQYWLGRSKTLVDPTAARLLQQEAYQSFLEQDDSTGQLLASAAVLEALHFEVLGFKPRDLWLRRLVQALQSKAHALCFDDDLWVHAILMSAATHCSPATPMLPAALARVKELLPHCSNVNLKVTVANMLHYSGVTRLDPEAVTIATREARAVLKSHELTADALTMYYIAQGLSHAGFGRYAEALECFRHADDVIDRYGLVSRIAFAGIWRGLCERRVGNLEGAEATIARSENACAGDDGFASFMLDHLKALIAFDRGDKDGAIAIGLDALERCDTSGLVITMIQNRLDNAYMLIDAGRAEQGRNLLAVLESRRASLLAAYYGGAAALLEAWGTQREADGACPGPLLSNAMGYARNERDRVRMRRFPRALEDLVPIALEQGIETQVARMLIRECNLNPPATLPELWPWPVRIYTLGRFELWVNDKPVAFGRKAPKRTIALLKALIALGGRNVSEQLLLDMLWPDIEGDAATKALSAALHRMRRLLGSHQAIRHREGMLSVNKEHCFVDAWTFEAGVERRGAEAAALQLYRGGFLQGDIEAPWSTSMRERLRAKFVRTVQVLGLELESAGLHDQAIGLYLRGIEADDLVEPFYQGLMRSYRALGRCAEAASIYRRLRQTLSITLGMQPGQESQRLFDELHLQ